MKSSVFLVAAMALSLANGQSVQTSACNKQATSVPSSTNCSVGSGISYAVTGQIQKTTSAVSAYDCYTQCLPTGNKCEAYTYACGVCYFINVSNPPKSVALAGAVSMPNFACVPPY